MSYKRRFGYFLMIRSPSSLVGAVVGTLWLRLSRQDRQTPLPFGPYLAMAGWIVFMWGETLIGAYLRVSGLDGG